MDRLTLEMKNTDGVLARFANQVGALGDGQARVAMSRAVNRAVDTTYTQVIRALVTQTSIKRAELLAQVGKSKSAQMGTGPIVGSIYATGSELPLSQFGPVQFSWGTRAKVWGKLQPEKGAFIFAGSWCNKGQPIAGGHVFVRTGKANPKSGRNNAIAELFGPSIPKEMVKDEVAETFLRVSREEVTKRLSHELSRLLA